MGEEGTHDPKTQQWIHAGKKKSEKKLTKMKRVVMNRPSASNYQPLTTDSNKTLHENYEKDNHTLWGRQNYCKQKNKEETANNGFGRLGSRKRNFGHHRTKKKTK